MRVFLRTRNLMCSLCIVRVIINATNSNKPSKFQLVHNLTSSKVQLVSLKDQVWQTFGGGETSNPHPPSPKPSWFLRVCFLFLPYLFCLFFSLRLFCFIAKYLLNLFSVTEMNYVKSLKILVAIENDTNITPSKISIFVVESYLLKISTAEELNTFCCNLFSKCEQICVSLLIFFRIYKGTFQNFFSLFGILVEYSNLLYQGTVFIKNKQISMEFPLYTRI